jgi:hypothetical protein
MCIFIRQRWARKLLVKVRKSQTYKFFSSSAIVNPLIRLTIFIMYKFELEHYMLYLLGGKVFEFAVLRKF